MGSAGSIPKKVREGILKVQNWPLAKIEQALRKVLNTVLAKLTKNGPNGKVPTGLIGIPVEFKIGKETHHLWVQTGSDGSYNVMMASDEHKVTRSNFKRGEEKIAEGFATLRTDREGKIPQLPRLFPGPDLVRINTNSS